MDSADSSANEEYPSADLYRLEDSAAATKAWSGGFGLAEPEVDSDGIAMIGAESELEG